MRRWRWGQRRAIATTATTSTKAHITNAAVHIIVTWRKTRWGPVRLPPRPAGLSAEGHFQTITQSTCIEDLLGIAETRVFHALPHTWVRTM